ncbi:hypothetical protein [Georgenia sp. Z1491]|uniref:hypothetical protein n=1 Tax=Georgenia sp. Z1491 TaxID=3416707 RepID=UPI003CEE11FE
MTTTRPRRSPLAAAAAALLLALVGGCAGGEVVGTAPPTDGTDSPEPPIPTTDDVLDVDPISLVTVDTLLLESTATSPALTLDEVRSLEDATLDHTGHDVALGLHPEDTSGGEAWQVWSVGDDEMALTELLNGRVDTGRSESFPLTEDEAGGTEALEIVLGWQVRVSDAVENALQVLPGEVLVAMPPDEPASILLVGIRTDDGDFARVGIEAVTGDVLNVVTPDPTTGDHDDQLCEQDGTGCDGDTETPTPHAPDAAPDHAPGTTRDTAPGEPRGPVA